ncbi:MAG TPA: hypothetical protein VG917_01950 [Patescibacteria group bacterium]|nr:hypothetical protein [Patescibacteria group bacterium]
MMQQFTKILNQITEAIIEFLKDFSFTKLAKNSKLLVALLAIIGLLFFFISAAFN